MEFSVLFFGDIVGEPGRDIVKDYLPQLTQKYQPDLLLANVDNVTHGKGINRKHYDLLKGWGFDGFTGGDHVWRFEEFVAELDKPDVLLARPANYPGAPGKGYLDFVVKGKRVRLIHLQGRVFMNSDIDNPFHAFDELAAKHPFPDAVIVDFHAEATSEKRCFAEYVGDRAQLVLGTHTHVPTADAQILPSGAAFISDVGMCGPQDSSLGADKNEALKKFLTGMPWRYSLGAGQSELGAIFCTIDLTKKRAVHIEHIRIFTNAE